MGGYGDQSFQLAFPRLYGIAIDKEVSVEASLSIKAGGRG